MFIALINCILLFYVLFSKMFYVKVKGNIILSLCKTMIIYLNHRGNKQAKCIV